MRWKRQEEKIVMDLYFLGRGGKFIAQKLNRPIRDVYAKISNMGLPTLKKRKKININTVRRVTLLTALGLRDADISYLTNRTKEDIIDIRKLVWGNMTQKRVIELEKDLGVLTD